MSTSIDQAFIKQFESEVHLAYQRFGSKLRNTVRTKNNVIGSTVRFQKAGKGTAGVKSRHGNVPIMNVDHSNVDATLADWYAGEYIDKLDELKINIDERSIATRSGAAALGRKTDDIILAAMDPTTNPYNVATATTWTTTAGPLYYLEAMGKNDVPTEDNELYHVISWEAWTDLMALPQFSSADYVAESDRPFAGPLLAKRWSGFLYFPFSGLLKDGNGDAKQYAYHRSAVGHAIGEDVTSDITWQGEKQAHLIVYRMSMGAVLIDPIGVIENVYDITP